jgi:uncharacterized membrane protein (DUF4010 family)
MEFEEAILTSFAVALGGGLLVGLDRERHKGQGETRSLAGIRTFAVVALTGAIAQVTGQPWLTALGAALLVALTSTAYWRSRSGDPGITTEFALFTTYLLGIVSVDSPAITAAGFVVLTTLLFAKARLHRFSTEVLTAQEIHDGLILAGAALVVLPLIPNRSIEALAGVNPRQIWSLVVLLMAVQTAGHVAMRNFGARMGLATSGLVSGFISSTATFAAMGARSRVQPELVAACAAGALLSNMASMVQLGLLAAAVFPQTLDTLATTLVVAIGLNALAALSLLRRQTATVEPLEIGRRAFDVGQTLGFALLLSLATTATALAAEHFGTRAAQIGAALVGSVEIHSAAMSLLSLNANGQAGSAQTEFALLLALSTNAAGKATTAYLAGGKGFGTRVSTSLLITLIALWTASWITR